MRVADASDCGLDAGLPQALRVTDREVLDAAVAMMDQTFGVTSRVRNLLQSIERQLHRHDSADIPTDALHSLVGMM